MEEWSWTSDCVPRCDILPSFIQNSFYFCVILPWVLLKWDLPTQQIAAPGSVSESGWELGESLPFGEQMSVSCSPTAPRSELCWLV